MQYNFIFLISLAFDVALPCFLEKGTLVNVTLRWSQFQRSGKLITISYDLQFYRSCVSNNTNSSIIIITGLWVFSNCSFNIAIVLFDRER